MGNFDIDIRHQSSNENDPVPLRFCYKHTFNRAHRKADVCEENLED